MNRFRFWHISDVPRDADDVRGWGQSAPRARVRGGQFDPQRKSRRFTAAKRQLMASERFDLLFHELYSLGRLFCHHFGEVT